ncbi:ankyrin repeat domain-containing protein [Nigerium massiliense]|uniref:ankyrin repeat domain-containing protein n=1 Tax=Nigerium massiliense TaxID=1522317 RepID=UPI000693E385|nr:ankyrin repeat domain-containing protein [Nigerium massiliense]
MSDANDLSPAELDALNGLFDAAREGDRTLLAAVDAGVPVNLTNSNGDTLLILAAYREQPEIAAGLLERGADPDRINDRGQTAIACAVFRQSEEIVRMLLNAGADPKLGAQPAREIARFFGLDAIGAVLDEAAGASEGQGHSDGPRPDAN